MCPGVKLKEERCQELSTQGWHGANGISMWPWLLGLSLFIGPSALLPRKGNWLSTRRLLLLALFFAEEGCSAPLNLEGVPRGLQVRPASLPWA